MRAERAVEGIVMPFIPDGHGARDHDAGRTERKAHFKSGLIGFLLAKALALLLASAYFASHESIRTWVHGAACEVSGSLRAGGPK